MSIKAEANLHLFWHVISQYLHKIWMTGAYVKVQRFFYDTIFWYFKMSFSSYPFSVK